MKLLTDHETQAFEYFAALHDEAQAGAAVDAEFQGAWQMIMKLGLTERYCIFLAMRSVGDHIVETMEGAA